jgi:hypothetical protein
LLQYATLFGQGALLLFVIPEVSRFRRLAQRSKGAQQPRTRELKEKLQGICESWLHIYTYIYIYHFIICPQSKLYTICTYMLNFKCIDNLHQDFRRFSYIYIGSPYLKTNAEPKINWWPIARSAYADGCLSLGSHCILDYFKILRLLGSNGSYRPGLWKWTIQVNLCKTWYPFKLVESHGVASII